MVVSSRCKKMAGLSVLTIICTYKPYVKCKISEPENNIPPVKYSGGSIMLIKKKIYPEERTRNLDLKPQNIYFAKC